jgi:hypothetical protein
MFRTQNKTRIHFYKEQNSSLDSQWFYLCVKLKPEPKQEYGYIYIYISIDIEVMRVGTGD